MNKDLLFSSKKDDWETPKDLFNKLNEKYNFTIDLCADDKNKLCKRYFTKENSCLDKKLYNEVIFCNPPYGKEIYKFVKKCSELSKDNIVIALLPARTDTKWFHEFIYKRSYIEFIKGRLHFGNNKNSAPFPSMIVKFKGGF